MVAVTEPELATAVQLKFQTAVDAINTTDFSATNNPTFEASATAFPNGRSEKFVDFNGSTQYFTFDASVSSMSKGIVHIWAKPDFAQTYGSDRCLGRTFSAAIDNGLTLGYFINSMDDWYFEVTNNGSNTASCITAGQTWSADSVLHMVYMWANDASLDGGKSAALYINNTLVQSATTTWNPGANQMYNLSQIGKDTASATYWDGGIADFAMLEYSTLAASHTDAEIVQALYSNTFNAGAHEFVSEIVAAVLPTAPTNLTFTSTGNTTATLTWDAGTGDDGTKIYQDGVLIDTIATVGLETYDLTGLVVGVDHTWYVVAYNGDGDSVASNTVANPSSGLTIVGRKIRLRSGTAGAPTTALTIDALQKTSLVSMQLTTPVYNDINLGLAAGKIPASNYPTWAALVGNIYQYQFAVNTYIDTAPLELLHDWKEGTPIELHVHWATGGLNDATVRGVKWEIEYCWANMGSGVFATLGPTSVETSIPAAQAALTHRYTSVVTFTPVGGTIGAYLCMRLKRIASVTNTAPAANPFGLAVGIHYQIDKLGSTNIGSN